MPKPTTARAASAAADAVDGDAPAYLTTTQVARRLALTPQALRNWRARGIGPVSVRLGGVVRYPREDFLAWERAEAEATRRGGGRIAG